MSIATPPGVKRIDVESAADMLNAVMKNIDGVDIFVATAAVADYRPANSGREQDQEDFGVDGSQDGTHRRHPRDRGGARAARPFVVGFAAETDSVEQYARQKLLKKNLDMIAANEVGHDKVFEKDDNALLVLWRDGRRELPHAPKVALARDLVALIAERYADRASGVRLASVSGMNAQVSPPFTHRARSRAQGPHSRCAHRQGISAAGVRHRGFRRARSARLPRRAADAAPRARPS